MNIAIVYSTATKVILRTIIPDNAAEEALILNGTWPSVRQGESVVHIDNANLPKNSAGQPIHALDHSIPEILARHGIQLKPPARLAVFDAAGNFVESVMADRALYKPPGRVLVDHATAGAGWTLDRNARTLQAPIVGHVRPPPEPVVDPEFLKP